MQSLDGAPSFGVMNHLKHHCGHTWPGPLSVELNMGWVGTSWQGEITALSASGVLGGWGYLALRGTWKNAPAHVVEKVGLVWVYEFKRISWPLCKSRILWWYREKGRCCRYVFIQNAACTSTGELRFKRQFPGLV